MLSNQSISIRECSPCVYPPFFVFFVYPLANVKIENATVVWYFVNILFLIGCFYLALKVIPVENYPFSILILSFFTTIRFIQSTIENRQYDSIVFFFILLGLFLLKRSKKIPAGISLGVSASLKATPLLFLLYLLYKKEWKTGVSLIITFLTLTLLPDLFFSTTSKKLFATEWLETFVKPLLFINHNEIPVYIGLLNQSLSALLMRCFSSFESEGINISIFKLSVLPLRILLFLVFSTIIITTAKWLKESKSLVIDFSLILIIMLLFSPISSKQHFVVLLLPHMFIINYLLNPKFAIRGETLYKKVYANLWVHLAGQVKSLMRLNLATLRADFANAKSGLDTKDCGVGIILGIAFCLHTLTSDAIVGRRLSDIFSAVGCIPIGTILIMVSLLILTKKIPMLKGKEKLQQEKKSGDK